jgi:hypothetical protein
MIGKGIFKATNKKTSEVTIVTDLYWFEEEGIHDMGGVGHYCKYDLEYIFGREESDEGEDYPDDNDVVYMEGL